jgi:hypothetical protein
MSREESNAMLRELYDGEETPHTDFVSKREAKELFGSFSHVKIDVQNFDDSLFRIKRERLLTNIAKIVGRDLYITADK